MRQIIRASMAVFTVSLSLVLSAAGAPPASAVVIGAGDVDGGGTTARRHWYLCK